MTKIIVTNGDWNGARAKLKSSLEKQNAAFSAQFKAAFAPPKPEAAAAGKQAPAQAVPADKAANYLARSRPRG